MSLLSENAAVMVPILFPALYKSSKVHWNRAIHSLLYNALKVTMEVNGPLFDECSHKFKVRTLSGSSLPVSHTIIHQAEQQKEKKKERDRSETWTKLETLAKKNPLAKQVGAILHEYL